MRRVGVVQHRLIRSVDDLSDAVASARMAPMSSRGCAVRGEWARVDLRGALVEVGGYSMPIATSGETLPGRFSVMASLTSAGAMRVNGEVLTPGHLFGCGGAAPVHAAGEAPTLVGVLSFDADECRERGRMLDIDVALPAPGSFRVAAVADWPRLQGAFLTTRRLARRAPGTRLDPVRRVALRDEVLDLVVRTFDVRRVVQLPGERQLNSVRIVSECVAYAARTRYDDISMSALCVVSGVSERRVRHAFIECFGMAPSAYLRMAALHAVRRTLVQGQPCRDAVSRAASDFGFAHLSRFAGQYRQLFGEPPSATLAHRSVLRAS